MGGRLVPPTEDLMAPAYAKNADKSDLWWRNILENPVTVQFDHRLLVCTGPFSNIDIHDRRPHLSRLRQRTLLLACCSLKLSPNR